ncbi:MAG: protein-L-isoaspartate(D-aspartate) O-methyltransferase [Desulfotomaculaceae bacterium]|nr:protein-L-isoaspartate(D-aspartate) O-methyltransferase [Desulfotomaculaceae bacterium]
MAGLRDDDNRISEREAMVKEQLIFRGIWNEAVQNSMLAVPRHLFVPENLKDYAYCDGPLSIGDGQTISQPYIVACMIEALAPGKDDVVLEIGTGSGYAAAVLSGLAAMVYTIERLASHAKRADALLKKLNYNNIGVITGDGTKGLPGKAPFDGILVSAGAPVMPKSLLEQLKIGGRLVIPLGTRNSQELLLISKDMHGDIKKRSLGAVRFVPLIGDEGWER